MCRGEAASFVVRYESLLRDPTIFVVKLEDQNGLYTKKNPFKLSLGAGETLVHAYDLAIPPGLPPGRYEVPIVAAPALSPQFTTSRPLAVVVGACSAAVGAASRASPVASAAPAKVTATATAGGGRDVSPLGAWVVAAAALAVLAVVAAAALLARRAAPPRPPEVQPAQAYYGYQYPSQAGSYYAGFQTYGSPYQRY